MRCVFEPTRARWSSRCCHSVTRMSRIVRQSDVCLTHLLARFRHCASAELKKHHSDNYLYVYTGLPQTTASTASPCLSAKYSTHSWPNASELRVRAHPAAYQAAWLLARRQRRRPAPPHAPSAWPDAVLPAVWPQSIIHGIVSFTAWNVRAVPTNGFARIQQAPVKNVAPITATLHHNSMFQTVQSGTTRICIPCSAVWGCPRPTAHVSARFVHCIFQRMADTHMSSQVLHALPHVIRNSENWDMKSLFHNMRPDCDVAAVCTMALWHSFLVVCIKPSTVRDSQNLSRLGIS